MVYTDTEELCPVEGCLGILQSVEPGIEFPFEGPNRIYPPPYYECPLCHSQWDLALEPLAF